MGSQNDWRASTLLHSLERGTEGFELSSHKPSGGIITAGECMGDILILSSLEGGNGRQFCDGPSGIHPGVLDSEIRGGLCPKT